MNDDWFMKSLKVVSMLVISLVINCACPAEAAVYQQGIDDVRGGKLQEAKASWWGFDVADSTRYLQDAINSRVRRLIVDKGSQPWVLGPIKCVSNQEIVFEKDVELLAKQGAFKGTSECLFTLANLENVSLTGYGATLRMRRSDYENPQLYKRGEWRHAVNILSSRNIKIYGLIITESGGDGIYLGEALKGVTNTNVHIKDVICDKNYRQGISVISAQDLLIEATVLKETGGAAPMAGIDFEPNGPEAKLMNCIMRNCITENNRGCGYKIYIPTLNSSSASLSLRFEHCKSIGDHGGAFSLTTGNNREHAVQGAIEVIGCDFQVLHNSGIAITGKPVFGCSLIFRNCTLSCLSRARQKNPPVIFISKDNNLEDLGGVTFEDVIIRDGLSRKLLGFINSGGKIALRKVNGTFILEHEGKHESVTITDELLHNYSEH